MLVEGLCLDDVFFLWMGKGIKGKLYVMWVVCLNLLLNGVSWV